jgi:hypothetical protein
LDSNRKRLKKLKQISGEIVGSQIANIPNTNLGYGYITIETLDSKYVKIKVDAKTKYETVERGERVTVQYDIFGKTDILSAKKISRRTQ